MLGAKYFPYPDIIVHFAYKIHDYTEEKFSDILFIGEEILHKLFPEIKDEMKREPDKYILYFPYKKSGDHLTLFRIIGYLQYILQTTSLTESKNENFKILSRIHLGSPHLFYRWLWKRKENENVNYQFVTDLPLYFVPPLSFDEKNMYPLDDSFDTMFLFDSEKKTVTEDILSTYCGDSQSKWESAYKKGFFGSYGKCAQLYLAQTEKRQTRKNA